MRRRLPRLFPLFLLVTGGFFLASGAMGCTKNGADKTAAPTPTAATPVVETPMTAEATPVPPTPEKPPAQPAEPVTVEETPGVVAEPPADETGDAERACKTDADCTFAPNHPCFCPTCKPTQRKAINRKTAKERLDFYSRAKFDCEPCPSPRCEQQWIGRTVACRKGLCTTVP